MCSHEGFVAAALFTHNTIQYFNHITEGRQSRLQLSDGDLLVHYTVYNLIS